MSDGPTSDPWRTDHPRQSSTPRVRAAATSTDQTRTLPLAPEACQEHLHLLASLQNRCQLKLALHRELRPPHTDPCFLFLDRKPPEPANGLQRDDADRGLFATRAEVPLATLGRDTGRLRRLP